jgi:hypothetical protein
MVVITVLPEAAKATRICTTLKAITASKPVVGSSKKSNVGSVKSSIPIHVLFFSPPEIPLIKTPPIFEC